MLDTEGYKDRTHAGKQLARRLRHLAGTGDPIVLGLPRGGVPVAFEVAQALGAELDVLLVRKLGMPHHEEYAMGAIGSGGVRVLQAGVPGLMGVTQEQVDQVTAREMAELARREQRYRGARPLPRCVRPRCARPGATPAHARASGRTSSHRSPPTRSSCCGARST